MSKKFEQPGYHEFDEQADNWLVVLNSREPYVYPIEVVTGEDVKNYRAENAR
ncbi:MAG: hypothetical protein ACJ788_24855 [Ktedonobacteraceae bacterium]